MRLEFLKRFVRIEARIVIFEADHQADRNAIVAQAVNPAAAVHAGIERPAERVRHISRLDATFRHFPQFLDADAVDLRIQAVEFHPRDHFLGERSARPFGEHRHLGAQFVARREVVLGLAVLVDALVVGDDAGDSVAFVDQLRAGKLREDIHARLLDQAAQPLHQLVHRDNVVAVIAQRRRRDRQFPGVARGQEVSGVVRDGRIERRSLLPIGNQLGQPARVHHRAGKLVRAEFARLFEDVDIFSGKFGLGARFVVLRDQSREMQRAGQSCRARADDQHIRVESFAFGHRWSLSSRRVALSRSRLGGRITCAYVEELRSDSKCVFPFVIVERKLVK